MGAHPGGVALLHRRIDGPARPGEVIDTQLPVEVADAAQRRIIEAHRLGDRAMSVALHRDRRVDLHLAPRGQKEHEPHRCGETEHSGTGSQHGPDATSAPSAAIG